MPPEYAWPGNIATYIANSVVFPKQVDMSLPHSHQAKLASKLHANIFNRYITR